MVSKQTCNFVAVDACVTAAAQRDPSPSLRLGMTSAFHALFGAVQQLQMLPASR
jgi:hypothetical protein